ncbi:MAG: 2Fe-2S iron-sulfur cluster binding domain-containing protein [Chloroflexi bacterium]|nr:2Fe-2S iron-sulfur cluster binding domain-containing protein [Chloroflexota bacterium]
MTDEIQVKVFRYDPSRDDAPRYDEFSVPRREGMVVGDVVEYIYENLDGSLAFRYECRTRQCGSCVIEINGRPAMMCMAPVGDALSLVLEPLGSLPVVRDLVTDRTPMLQYSYQVERLRRAPKETP